MGIFSLFKQHKVDKKWQNLIDGASDNRTKEILVYIVKNFFIPDNIDEKKFKANFEILRNNSRELYKIYAGLMNEPDFSKFGTVSIDKLAKVYNQPLGYRDWFMAAYPDVVNWFQDIDDEEAMKILGNPSNEETFDEEHKIKIEYLRKITDSFKENNHNLECI